ncbi:DUF1310 family protein [Enterococcus sp. LJL51]|uniref:DUF1310 family protein n=1 Tax=Enterococcus sp. LJL51 TaxID=3416656 RepID=UPI003CEBADAA
MVNQTKNEKENTTDLEIKRIRKSVVYKIVGLIVVIIAGIGMKVYMNEKNFNDEMMKVVNSDEAKKIYEETIINNDPSAFTPNGVIQSYKIDYNSVKHNPMGGIMLILIINNNENLYIHVTLSKDYEGSLDNSSGGASSKLDDLLSIMNLSDN